MEFRKLIQRQVLKDARNQRRRQLITMTLTQVLLLGTSHRGRHRCCHAHRRPKIYQLHHRQDSIPCLQISRRYLINAMDHPFGGNHINHRQRLHHPLNSLCNKHSNLSVQDLIRSHHLILRPRRQIPPYQSKTPALTLLALIPKMRICSLKRIGTY